MALLEQSPVHGINELKALREESVQIPVRLPQMADIGAAHRGWWRHLCSKCRLKLKHWCTEQCDTGKKRKSSKVLNSVPVNKRQRTSHKGTKCAKSELEPVYCICRQPADAVECMMVMCVVCKVRDIANLQPSVGVCDCAALSEMPLSGVVSHRLHWHSREGSQAREAFLLS